MMRTRESEGSYSIEAIGAVESDFQCASQLFNYATEVRIRIDPALERGLVGIEYFSHLWVIYRQHRSGEWLKEKGWGDEAPLVLPLCDDRTGQGVFSSRAPCRPAALGSCIVKLIRREAATLVVQGLDAFDGTPVLDVKPYVPRFDAVPDAVVPLHWSRVMDRDDDAVHLSREFHWDSTNAEFALGLRAGAIALSSLRARRGEGLVSEIAGGFYFAQGWEAATGCSPLRGTLRLCIRSIDQGPWKAELALKDRKVSFLAEQLEWSDAASVLSAPESKIVQYNIAPQK
jgi:tRNA-Thr(GGU) m(6)t(6)A37 methyltransferase TsaA